MEYNTSDHTQYQTISNVLNRSQETDNIDDKSVNYDEDIEKVQNETVTSEISNDEFQKPQILDEQLYVVVDEKSQLLIINNVTNKKVDTCEQPSSPVTELSFFNNVKEEKVETCQQLTTSVTELSILNNETQERVENCKQLTTSMTELSIANNTIKNNIETHEQSTDSTVIYKWVPKLINFATEEYKPTKNCEKFTKGCLWSPDGTCLLTASDDFRFRIYELPLDLYSGQLVEDRPTSVISAPICIKEGGIIYDYCWNPYTDAWNPITCCFLSASKESPVHLWDAFNGSLRATYRAYNCLDEVEAAISTQFVHYNTQIWCGFKNILRVFDTERPGRQVWELDLKKKFPNVTGLVSCIRENPTMPGLVAFGTYSKKIGLFQNSPICALETDNGVTQIEFSPDGTKLFSATRRSDEFLCWDLRNPGTILYSFKGRKSNTNQKIQFAISRNGTDIISGGTDGILRSWDTAYLPNLEVNLDRQIRISQDCVNGISLHPTLPLFATSTGQRICDTDDTVRDNGVQLWWMCNNPINT